MSSTAVLTRTPIEVIFLPLDQLVPWEDNPCRMVDATSLAELTASIAEHGVLQPLLVRPAPGASRLAYQVIAGSRRYQAARAAGLSEVPARVYELTDEEAMEIAIVDNLHRADLHPLEEAECYKQLLEQANGDMDSLATTIGKSAAYITKRLALLHLVPVGREHFLDGRLTVGHAILLSRLQPADQNQALTDVCFERLWEGHRQGSKGTTVTVEGLRRWIETNTHLKLSGAPWKRVDQDLLRQAPACADCPQRTGANPRLFDDIGADDICTNPACFNAKMAAFIEQTVARLRAQGKQVLRLSRSYAPSGRTPFAGEAAEAILYARGWSEVTRGKPCPHVTTGIVVDGWGNRGQLLKICATPTCPTHKAGLLGHSVRSAEEATMRRKTERARKIEQTVRGLVLDQIVQADRPTLSPDEMRLIAVGIMGRLLHESRKLFAQRRNIEPLKTKWGGKNYDGPARRLLDQVPITALPTLLLELTLLDELYVATYNMPGSTKPKRLLAAAQLCGVDPDTIRAKIVAAARAKKKRPGSTIRKKAGKKSPKTRRAPRRQASGARTTDAGDSAA